MNWQIKDGDCLEVLRKMEMNTVDALVTDPPAGISFMGKDWDGDKGGRAGWIAWMTDVMRECMRVMKPGAHGLVWAIPRTSHWTATALEDAGFEIRDVVTHLFGSGFPKSMNISIAIDKQAGELGNRGVKIKMGNGDRGVTKPSTGTESFPQHDPISEQAKQWQGWGTALKPASEHWILVRKPLSEKNVAKNVEKWGVGGINIDGTRIATEELTPRHNHGGRKDKNVGDFGVNGADFVAKPSPLGRFPANLVFSHSEYCTDEQCDIECAIQMLDEQSGFLHPAGNKNNKPANDYEATSFHVSYGNKADRTYKNDKGGGASRFFYCAKASKADKGDGNVHPTVKSSKLMRYLIRMVTPPNGLVLDPFTGSGSTGVAAVSEGFRFIGIEQEQEYISIAKMRMINAVEEI